MSKSQRQRMIADWLRDAPRRQPGRSGRAAGAGRDRRDPGDGQPRPRRAWRGQGPARRARSATSCPTASSPAMPRPSSTALLAEWVDAIIPAGNLLVMRTPPGSANLVANAIDAARLDDIAGTIAGDDTIFVALADGVDAHAAAERLQARRSGTEPRRGVTRWATTENDDARDDPCPADRRRLARRVRARKRRPPASRTTITVRSEAQKQLFAANDLDRAIALKRAIMDIGLVVRAGRDDRLRRHLQEYGLCGPRAASTSSTARATGRSSSAPTTASRCGCARIPRRSACPPASPSRDRRRQRVDDKKAGRLNRPASW